MQHIIQHLFSADSLDEVPRERLETLVKDHPSFSLGRFLLSSKLRAENSDDFAEETRKTNLYFTNPFWLQWLLESESPDMPEELIVEKKIDAALDVPEILEIPEVSENPEVSEISVIPEVPEIPKVSVAPEVVTPVIAEEEPSPGELPTVEESYIHFTGTPLEEAVEHAFEMPVAEEVTTPVEQPRPEPGFSEPVAPPLVFESYHMIDYFASQGIKLAPDENPSDRLGKQMKSFTEWLKVMKRLPQKEALAVPDPITENKIQAIAADSIESREVVTETMAEVLALQGMREQASEVYHKLSLLNPGKSGYFAAKIEQLKTN